jgi:hypothetical protein
MTNEELESIHHEISELQKAVRKANPFLRSVLEIRGFAIFSLPIGFSILAYCLFSYFLVHERGSIQALPTWWFTLSWICLALFLVVSSVAKWIIVNRRAAQTEAGATFWTAIKAMYGGGWVSLYLPITICIFVLPAFLIWAGHPWYLVPTLAICLGLACGTIVMTVEAKEYIVTGWYALATGLGSLFFVEASPFICTAVVWAGTFLVFGVAGLAGKKGR